MTKQKHSEKNKAKKLLDALKEKAPLNDNRGPLLREGTLSHSKKDLKRKGHKEGCLIHPKMKWVEVKEAGIDPEKYWNDWTDKRDGFRFHTNSDQLYHKWKATGQRIDKIYEQNIKIRKQIKIREARLMKKQIKEEEINNG